jgi:3-methyladenine DNA glycosylase/8-oxoguanine DNA glycosylase
MRWRNRRLGLRFRNVGTVDGPAVQVAIFSRVGLSRSYVRALLPEVAWRFNFNQDISKFTETYADDAFLRPAIERWRGMKPVAANSLYETLMIYVVIQNAVVRRSIQMLEALFGRIGRDVRFDGRTLSTFWTPREMLDLSEAELRRLKVGYRAKTFRRISEAFATRSLDEQSLRGMPQEAIGQQVGNLYGVGPATLEYLLFEDFYFLGALRVIPPWERKIMSRLLFDRPLVSEARILRFFRTRFPRYEKLAFHYLWEDLFWRRDHETIAWLEREIRRS